MKRIHFTVSSLIIFSGLAAAAEEGIRRFLRSNGQKKNSESCK
jgi:hypothetical protein